MISKLSVFVLSFLFSVSLFAGGLEPETKPSLPNAPAKMNDDCPPMPDCSTPKEKPKPKPKKKAKPKPKKTVQDCPKCAKCPTCPTCAKCPECKPVVQTKVVEKEKIKYIDRTVTIDETPKNTLSLLVGAGPHGIVTDYYETSSRQDEYAVRKEKEKAKGGVIGLQYSYRFSPSFSAGAIVLSNETIMASGGIHW